MSVIVEQCGGCGKVYGFFDCKTLTLTGRLVPMSHEINECEFGVDYFRNFKHP
jgi:hypothetical protein